MGESRAAPEGKHRDSQSSTLHRNQQGLQLDTESGDAAQPALLPRVAANSGSEHPRPSPPSLIKLATQVAENLGTKGPTQTTNATQKLPIQQVHLGSSSAPSTALMPRPIGPLLHPGTYQPQAEHNKFQIHTRVQQAWEGNVEGHGLL